MDKITRLLELYSRLSKGEKINKTAFCMESGCSSRSFDRDIEDMRLYLSDSLFCNVELIYNRREKLYYFSGTHKKKLEAIEYSFIERMLLDTGILRKDEMKGLLSNLLANTERSIALIEKQKDILEKYIEPLNKKPILKMYGDLDTIIKNKSLIEIKYIKANNILREYTVIPCTLKVDLGYLYLIAFIKDNKAKYPAYLRVDRIYSFEVVGKVCVEEKIKVENYLNKYSKGITQMFGGEFIEIIVECKNIFYPYVHDKFKESQIISQNKEKLRVRIFAFDNGFLKWIISQPTELITVIEPISLRTKIKNEAIKLFDNYGGESNEKKDKVSVGNG